MILGLLSASSACRIVQVIFLNPLVKPIYGPGGFHGFESALFSPISFLLALLLAFVTYWGLFIPDNDRLTAVLAINHFKWHLKNPGAFWICIPLGSIL